jgi:hypothetical protein
MDSLPPIYIQSICTDIEKESSYKLISTPNVVILADVLEHTRDPINCLKSLLHHLEPGTRVVLSVPNVAHFYVRMMLLAGKFNYTDRGILDRTHLRFFTYSTLHQLCEQCFVRVNQVDSTPVPLPLIYPIFKEGEYLYFLHKLNAGVAMLIKRFFAYQFICYGTWLGKKQELHSNHL